MPSSRPPGRLASLGLACVLAGGLLAPLAATPAQAAPVASVGFTTPPIGASFQLRSGELAVTVDAGFPQVVRYTDRDSGAALLGNDARILTLTVNGTAEPVEVASRRHGQSAVDYVITPTALPAVSIEARLSVKAAVVTIAVTKIVDPEGVVDTLEIPDHRLVTVSSAEPGAAISGANLSVDRNVSGDLFLPITAETPLDATPVGSNAIIANTGQLAAAFATNALYDSSEGPANKDSGNFWRQAVSNGEGGVEVGIASGPWLYRAQGSDATEELPWVKVAITPDANDDGVTDWQDGAIAMRDIRVAPNKGDQTPENVITHIPLNFASQATHPFLRTLDDVKRIALNTDGLGQVAMFKGFTSEGHDSANTDYGDNFNERAGGLDDLNAAVEAGEKWNASFGVHINATEIYPEAKSFSDALADESAKGWDWLDQSYFVDQRYDRVSGELDRRIEQLANATHDNLDFAYVDVYYEFGWLAQSIQDSLVDHGFRVGSEWSDKLSENNTWAHWANDENYGGATNKGVNSQILRFVNNTQADVWNPDPMLGTSHVVEFEGWTGQNDFPAFLQNVWTANLPTKFLQHHEILRWTSERIDLEHGVSVTGTSTDDRQITVDGDTVLQGGAYLLPWASDAGKKIDKLYHYNAVGGQSTWQLTDDFDRSRSLQLFTLDDSGRTKVGDVTVIDGALTIDAVAGQAYVLVAGKNDRTGSALPNKDAFGEGTPVDDPGFNALDLEAWNPSGSAAIERDDLGRRAAVLGAGESSISQRLDALEAGTYAVSADVGIEAGSSRTTSMTVDVPNGERASTTIDSSGAINLVADDEWRDTNLQRLRAYVTIPESGVRPTLSITVGDGDAPVRIDNVRVVASDDPNPGGDVLVEEDFERVDQGWGPFFKGDAGGTTHPRTHITERHEPYTQQGWNGRAFDMVLDGDWSLLAHEENRGLVYRTSEYTVPFQAGHRYRISFDYQSGVEGAYSFVTGVDQRIDGVAKPVELSTSPFGERHSTTEFTQELDTGACGDYFVGLRRNSVGAEGADLVLDNLRIVDLGESEQTGACSNLTLTGPASGFVPGEAAIVTTTFTNYEAAAANDLVTSLNLPEGWMAIPAGPTEFAAVAPGATVKTTWQVTAPVGLEPGSHPVSARGDYTVGDSPRAVEASASFRTLPTGLIPQSRLAIAAVSDSEPGSAPGAIDGDASTMWHSEYAQSDPDTPYPHWIALDLGDTYRVDGFDYQVRKGNGSIKSYELYVSADGTNWGTPVAGGSFESTAEVQHLSFATVDARFVKLVGLSSINGAAFAGANELNVWGTRDAAPLPLPKGQMTIADVDSEETVGEDGGAVNVLDGEASTFWVSEWSNASPDYPHHVTVDLAESFALRGMSIQQRPGTELNGRIKAYEAYVSTDGVTWGDPVAAGELTTSSGSQNVSFAGPVMGRYVKVVALSSHNGAPWAAIAELEFFQAE